MKYPNIDNVPAMLSEFEMVVNPEGADILGRDKIVKANLKGLEVRSKQEMNQKPQKLADGSLNKLGVQRVGNSYSKAPGYQQPQVQQRPMHQTDFGQVPNLPYAPMVVTGSHQGEHLPYRLPVNTVPGFSEGTKNEEGITNTGIVGLDFLRNIPGKIKGGLSSAHDLLNPNVSGMRLNAPAQADNQPGIIDRAREVVSDLFTPSTPMPAQQAQATGQGLGATRPKPAMPETVSDTNLPYTASGNNVYFRNADGTGSGTIQGAGLGARMSDGKGSFSVMKLESPNAPVQQNQAPMAQQTQLPQYNAPNYQDEIDAQMRILNGTPLRSTFGGMIEDKQRKNAAAQNLKALTGLQQSGQENAMDYARLNQDQNQFNQNLGLAQFKSANERDAALANAQAESADKNRRFQLEQDKFQFEANKPVFRDVTGIDPNTGQETKSTQAYNPISGQPLANQNDVMARMMANSQKILTDPNASPELKQKARKFIGQYSRAG